jgi:hypothetical protein
MMICTVRDARRRPRSLKSGSRHLTFGIYSCFFCFSYFVFVMYLHTGATTV